MKKGLLTVLLASLVLVGCQNYDDQFDDLNAQISALKSQVDGLASLSGQVNALSGTISGLQSGISAATAAANAAGTAATAAGATASSNATAIAAATAAATAAGASADAATAAATAATTAATEAVAAGATNATAIAAATAAATAAGVSADAATAAANAATTAATAAASATDLTALSTSLTALAADVAKVQASLATAATAAAVTALQAEIDAIEADLDDLLATSNVYATAIDIDSAADMAAALALGNKVALMNATVNIEDSSTIADADIQTFVDRIATMNGAFTYTSSSATGFVPTFDNMVSAKAITITAAGDISFAKLASATDIVIHDDFETKITSFSMPLLASVDGIDTDEGSAGVDTDALNLDSATNIDLGSLARYGSALQIHMKEGGTLDIASLDDVNTLGKQSDLALTISGPASLSLSKIEGGALSLTNVATATVSGLYSAITVNGGVETLTVTKGVSLDLSGAADLETATLNLVNSYDADFTTATAALAAKGNSSTYTADLSNIAAPQLKSLTLTGNWLDLTINSGESNLTTLSIDGTFDDLSIIGAPDLTTLTVSAATKFGDLTLQDNPNLVVADFDHSFSGAQQTTAATSSTVLVDSNASLQKFHYAADDVASLTITDNAKLAELDLTGLADDGASTASTVYIYDNNLTAVSATNSKDSDTAIAAGTDDDGEAGDSGSFDNGTSGMKTAQAYIDHVSLQAAATAYVTFDKLSTLTNSESGTDVVTLNTEPSASGVLIASSAANATTVLLMVPAEEDNSVPEKGATKAKQAFQLDWLATGSVQLTVNGVALFETDANGVGGDGTALVIGTSNKDLQIQAIESAVNLARATAAGVTLDATRGYGSSQTVSLAIYASEGSTDTSLGQRYSTKLAAGVAVSSTNYGIGVDDLITFTVGGNGGNSVQFSLTGVSETSTDIADIGDGIVTAWERKYGAGGTASGSAIATIVDTNGKLTITMLQTDSAGYGIDVDMSVEGGTVTSTNAKNLTWTIGDSQLESDDATVDSDIIVSIESTVAGVDENTISTVVTTGGAGSTVTWVALAASSYTANKDFVSNYVNAQVNRTDVRTAEDTVDKVASTAADAVFFDRTAWLG
jgi:hypothetical protein